MAQAREELWEAWGIEGPDRWAVEDAETDGLEPPENSTNTSAGTNTVLGRAISNVERDQFDNGQVLEVIRMDLQLPGEPKVKACARYHIDEAERETFYLLGQASNGRKIFGLLLRKPSWDFASVKEETTDVSISGVGKVPMRIVDTNAMAYWFGHGVENGAFTDATLDGIEISVAEMKQISLPYFVYSKYWITGGISFEFGGNEPKWFAAPEPNKFVGQQVTNSFNACVNSLAPLVSAENEENSGPTSPFAK